MREVFDSLEDWPKISLQDVSEPMAKFHFGETEMVVATNDRTTVSFFLDDSNLENLARAIVNRQEIRRLQKAI